MSEDIKSEGAPLVGNIDDDDVKTRRCCGCMTIGTFNVVWCGLCFLFLFGSFNPIQSLQTSLPTNPARASYGFIGIAVLYGSFSVASLFASQFVRLVGQRLGLFLGALCYLLYIGTLLILALVTSLSDSSYAALYFTASSVIGIGASVLWTSQGSLLAVMAEKSNLGALNGIFWSLFMVSYIFGGLITEFVLKSTSRVVLYAVFSSLAGVAVLGLLLLRPTPSLSPSHSKAGVERLNLLETVRILFERRFRLLLPAMCYSGFSASFNTALYTAYIGSDWVGLTLVVYGCVEVLGSLVGGRISDRVGRTPVFLVSCMCSLTGVLVASLSPQTVPKLEDGAWMYLLAFAFLGLGDSGFNTQVQGALGHFMKNNSQPAFAAYRFILSVTSMTGSIAGSYINLKYLSAPWQILLPCVVLWCVLFVAMICWVILDVCVERVSESNEDRKGSVQ